jgi:hypothetical protein
MGVDQFCPGCHSYNRNVSEERPYCTFCKANIYRARTEERAPNEVHCPHCRISFGGRESDFPQGQYCPYCAGELVAENLAVEEAPKEE